MALLFIKKVRRTLRNPLHVVPKVLRLVHSQEVYGSLVETPRPYYGVYMNRRLMVCERKLSRMGLAEQGGKSGELDYHSLPYLVTRGPPHWRS